MGGRSGSNGFRLSTKWDKPRQTSALELRLHLIIASEQAARISHIALSSQHLRRPKVLTPGWEFVTPTALGHHRSRPFSPVQS